MDFSLRPATQDDYPFIVSLHHSTLREYIEPIWGWEEERWNGFVKEWFVPEKVQIICVGDAAIGILATQKREGEIFLESISLMPSQQNRGLGSLVISLVLREAGGQKKPVVLSVLKTNFRAKKLYERLGFHAIKSDETQIEMRWSPIAGSSP